MFWRELLVTFADGESLGALNEAARSLGIFFDIHDRYLPFARSSRSGEFRGRAFVTIVAAFQRKCRGETPER